MSNPIRPNIFKRPSEILDGPDSPVRDSVLESWTAHLYGRPHSGWTTQDQADVRERINFVLKHGA
jgi:hypothetical protein